MKPFIYLSMLVWVAFQVGRTASAADEKVSIEMSPIIKEEYRITKEDFRNVHNTQRAKLTELEQLRTKAIAAAKRQAQFYTAWVDHLGKYDALVNARYTDEKGEFNPALEIAQRDQDNINKLFGEYLRRTPLVGRVSASESRRMIVEGQEKLKELAGIFGSPSESNNGELEVLAWEKLEAEKVLNKVILLAGQLGFNLKEGASGEAPKSGPTTSGRVPASSSR